MNYKYIIPYVMCLLFVSQITNAQKLNDALKKIEAYHLSLSSQLQTQNSTGLKDADLKNWIITSEHVSGTSGVHHIYYRQTVNNIEVYGAEASIHFMPNGEILSKNNKFIADIASKIKGGKSPSLTPMQAVAAAAKHSGYIITENPRILEIVDAKTQEFILNKAGISSTEIPVKLMYIQKENGDVVLVWSLAIDDIKGRNYFNFKVDAQTGEIIDQIDWQTSCGFEHVCETHHKDHDQENDTHFSDYHTDVITMEESLEEYYALLGGSYRVYAMPVESPNYGGRTLVTGAENLIASPYGWHDTNGAPGVEHTNTRGNNVRAYDDINGSNSPGTYAEGGTGLNFDFALNTTWSTANRSLPAAITNLFYWSNITHDVVYQYGFDEASGNFQQNNYGKGGSEGDYVRAEAQDGGGTCNANFATPNDGSLPRMQMYVCNSRDGDLDNGVIIHEYGHGISTRLTGGRFNSGCLSTASTPEQMGEGWSDYYALLLTMKPGDIGTQSRPIGTWLVGQAGNGPGIREFPYSTNMAVNSHTYNRTQTAVAPHGVGSVWAMMLWEMTWGLIDQYGFDTDFYNGTGGNNISLALVTEGLKIQPCSPGFVDGRDAILAADLALYGGANQCIIWQAFAKRGLGYSASQGTSASNADNIQAFDLPPTTFLASESYCVTEGVQSGLTGGSPGGGAYSGPGVTDDGNGSTYTFDPNVAGIGNHTVTYTSICGGTANIIINVTEAPNAPSVTSDTFCSGDSVTLSATPNDPGNTIEWYDAATGGTLLFTGPSYTFNPVSTTSVYAEEVLDPVPTAATVTHSNSQNISTGSVYCNAGNTTHTNTSHWRVFNLSNEFGITEDFIVSQIQFGVQSVNNNYTLSVRLHTLSGAFNTSNLTLLGSINVPVSPANNGNVVSAPFSTTVPAGSILVMEVFTPANGTTLFFPGSNGSGQSGPSYISAADCGITQPTNLANVGSGFPNIHYVMNILGEYNVASFCTGTRAEAIASADSTPPLAVAQDFTVYLDVNGQATVSSGDIDNGSNDNCAIDSMSVSPNVFNCSSLGNQIVTLTVTDTAGNFSTAQANVTVIDNLVPNIGTASNQTISSDVNCQATLADYTSLATATDNCGTPPITQNPAPGTLITGTTTVTLTATDASGNFATTSFDVIIEDSTNPTIQSIADQTTAGDASCQATLADFTALAVVSDNCDTNPSVSQLPAPGTVFSGTTSVTLTVTDASGNESSTSFDVTVEDNTNPTINAITDQTVSGNASCEGTVADYTGLAVMADNCDAAPVVTQSPVAGTTFSGTTSVTLTVTDASGNESSTSFDVTVEDSTNPTIQSIADQTTAGDASCQATLADFTALAVVSDNCDANPVVTQNPIAGTIFSGTTTVTLTVTDASGNDSATSFDVTVEDTTNPSIQPIANQTASGDFECRGIVSDYTSLAIVTDNCDTAPSVTQSPAIGTTFSGTTSVTLTATDASGNESSTSFDVTVEDSTNPTIQSIADQTTAGDASCQATLADFTALAVVSDNCDTNPSVSQLPAPGTVFSGTTSVTLTVTDASGNESSTSFDVTVEDSTNPTIQSIADQTTAGDASCQATLADFTALAVVSDNCDTNPSVSQLPAPGTVFSGTTSVTLTATDASGNESSTSFDVTVEDTTNPTIDAVADQTVSGNASCEGTVADYTGLAVVADNCDAAPVVTQSPAAGTTFGGTTSVTLTVTDASGNESSTSFDVTVEDTTDPTINAIADQTVSGNASCEGTVADYTGLAIVADNCDAAPVVTQSPVAGTTFSGTTSVTLTVTDASGNESSTSFDVTVEDTTNPTIDAVADQTVSGNASCEGTVADYTGLAVVADNCDAAPVVTQSPAAGTTFSGTTSVTLTVTDASGNESSTSFDVTVEDNTNPTINAIANQTVSGNASCEGTVADYTGLAVVADNCDAAPVVTQSPVAGTTFSGTTSVTLTVTDASGNESSTSFDVTVEDTTDPTINAIANQTVSGNASCEGTVADYTGLAVVADNCDAAPVVTQSPAVGTTFSGTTSVTLTVTDASGNESSTSFDVTVEDTTDPTINAIADQTVSGNASCEGTVADYTGLAIVADNCDAAPVVTQSPAAGTTFSGTTSVTLTVTDASGNESSTSFDVTVEDTTDPTINAVADQTVSGNASCEGTVADYTGLAVVADNCDAAPVVTQSPVAGTTFSGTTSVTLTVTDASGNESSTSFDVTVEDNTNPTINAIADQTVSGNASCEGTVADYTGLAVVADNCDAAPVVTQSPAVGTTFSGTTSVTLTVTDASGNESSTSFDVTVEDTTHPTINAVADQTVSGNASCEGTVADYTGLAVVADNCDATPVVTQSPAPGTTFSGTTSVTLTVTDASGNESSTSFDVTVEDNTNPTINAIANQTVSGNASCEGTVADYTGLAVVADNCDAAPVVTQSPAVGTTFGGTTSVTLTVTDASGNESSTSFDVTVEDTTNPTIDAITDQTVSGNASCEGTVADYTGLAVVADNCDAAPIVTQSPAVGTTFGGTTSVTLTVTDASGNESSTSFDVTVEDSTNPTIQSIADQTTAGDASCQATLADFTVLAVVSDNCDANPVVTQNPIAGTIFSGTTTVTLTVTDVSGNDSATSFDVTVEDTTNPSIQPIANQTASGDFECRGIVSDYTSLAIVTDNCDTAPSVTQSPAIGTTFSGTTSVTLTVTDASGNESSTSFDVTVEDNTNPTINAIADQTVSGNASCEGTVADYTGLAIVADNCDAAPVVSQSPVAGTTFNGTTSVTLTVTDASGNESSTSFDVTVEDTTDPTINAIADQTVSGNTSCEGTVADYTGLAVVADNCDAAPVVTQSPAIGTTFNGTTSVTLTVTDASGNESSTSFDVTVEDNTNPTINAIADQTVSGNASCEGTVADYTGLAIVADNCDAAPVVTQSPVAGTTFSGTTSVTLTVTDASGNESSTSFDVTVEDTTDPTINAIADQTVSGNTSCEGTVANYTGLAVVADNCDAAPVVTQSPAIGTTFNGTTSVTLTVTDASGNESSTSFDVTVEDTTDPTINAIADQTVSGNASCEGTVADYTGLAVVADNCDAAPVVTQSPAVGTTFNGTTSVTLTVTDASGNESSTSFDVTVEDSTNPTIQSIADQTTAGDASCQATLADFTALAVVSDNCDTNPSVSQLPAPGTVFSGTTSVTLTATDASGNESSTSFDVTVEDTTNPTIDAIADQTVSGNASCEGTVADYTGLAIVADNCDAAPVVTQSPAVGTTFSGTTSVTLTVTDASGNESSTSFDVTVEDTTNPTINAIADQTVSGNASCEGTVADYTGLAVVADNCDAAPVVSQSPVAGTTFNGTTSVTLTVTDASGNESSTSFDVSVEDVTAPFLENIDDRIIASNSNCEANLPDYSSLAIVTDNCDLNPIISQSPAIGTVFAESITVTITATDASGNSSFTMFNVTIVDTLDPVIECPEDMVVVPNENGNYILPDFTFEAIAFDNCTISPEITQLPEPGTVFTEGSVNTITLIATDDAGNSSECSFILEVEENLSIDNDALYGNDIILYPSPAENYFMIQNKGNIILSKMDIFDIRGRLVTSHFINSEGNNLQFDVSNLAGGVYWISIFSENGKINKRLVVD